MLKGWYERGTDIFIVNTGGLEVLSQWLFT